MVWSCLAKRQPWSPGVSVSICSNLFHVLSRSFQLFLICLHILSLCRTWGQSSWQPRVLLCESSSPLPGVNQNQRSDTAGLMLDCNIETFWWQPSFYFPFLRFFPSVAQTWAKGRSEEILGWRNRRRSAWEPNLRQDAQDAQDANVIPAPNTAQCTERVGSVSSVRLRCFFAKGHGTCQSGK